MEVGAAPRRRRGPKEEQPRENSTHWCLQNTVNTHFSFILAGHDRVELGARGSSGPLVGLQAHVAGDAGCG